MWERTSGNVLTVITRAYECEKSGDMAVRVNVEREGHYLTETLTEAESLERTITILTANLISEEGRKVRADLLALRLCMSKLMLAS